MEMAKADQVLIENARNSVIDCKRLLNEYPEVFDSYMKIHGNPSKDEIDNEILIGDWETKVRVVMKKSKSI